MGSSYDADRQKICHREKKKREGGREGGRAPSGLQLTNPKLGQRKADSQHSLKLQNANISPMRREKQRILKSWCISRMRRGPGSTSASHMWAEDLQQWGRKPCSSMRNHWCIPDILKYKHFISIPVITFLHVVISNEMYSLKCVLVFHWVYPLFHCVPAGHEHQTKDLS